MIVFEKHQASREESRLAAASKQNETYRRSFSGTTRSLDAVLPYSGDIIYSCVTTGHPYCLAEWMSASSDTIGIVFSGLK
jgi:hypothetical protein